MNNKTLLLGLFVMLSANVLAQKTDTTAAQDSDITKIIAPYRYTDSVSTDEADSAEQAKEDSVYYAEQTKADKAYRRVPADTSAVTARTFSQNKLEELRDDADMQFKEPSTAAESFFQRLMRWIGQFLESLLKASIETNWGRVLTWAIALAVLIFIIFMVLKVNAFNILFGRRSVAAGVSHNVFDENIHEMDFEKLIEQAVSQNDYRRGVRLLFLYALKLLADKQHIYWEQGKTNHDYVAELKADDLKNGLNDLSYYFDYAWYGNFAINRELFAKVNDIFTTWKTRL